MTILLGLPFDIWLYLQKWYSLYNIQVLKFLRSIFRFRKMQPEVASLITTLIKKKAIDVIIKNHRLCHIHHQNLAFGRTNQFDAFKSSAVHITSGAGMEKTNHFNHLDYLDSIVSHSNNDRRKASLVYCYAVHYPREYLLVYPEFILKKCHNLRIFQTDMPAIQNLVSSMPTMSARRPSDVVKMFQNKTISTEILDICGW